jgi:hypothetical protein
MMHLGLGDKGRALGFIEKALEEQRGWLAYANVNPVFDLVRDEPRFKAIVRKMNLEEGAGRRANG